MTPTGHEASVHVQLRFSAFFGYGSDTEAEMRSLSYLGPQCHGNVWPATDHANVADWPIAPPMVSGKVRTQTQPLTHTARFPLPCLYPVPKC